MLGKELTVPGVSVSVIEAPPSTDGPKFKISDNSGRLSPHHHYTRKVSSTSDHSGGDGPVRRKSILHNAAAISGAHESSSHSHHVNLAFQDDKSWNGDIHKFSRSVSRQNSFHSQANSSFEHSWLYIFCTKCHQKEGTESWEPTHWQKICPYPFCPTYRHFARLLALVLIGLLIWGLAYCIMGQTAAPGGQLFGLAILCLVSNLGGWLLSLVTMPALTGMLLTGILLQNVGLVNINQDYQHVCGILRKIALVIILTRAGLDLDPAAMKKLYLTIIRVGLIPWLIEFVVIAVASHLLLGLPWHWGFMAGSVVAAVSPAVVVPCLFRLRRKGYGVSKGIPTIIIAISGIDDAASVAVFGIILGMTFSSDLVMSIVLGPLSFILGIGFGVLWGLLSKNVPEINDPFVVPLRILLLLFGGLIAVFGSEKLGFDGAGPLGCVTAAFFSNYFWTNQGWDVEDNPVATAFEIIWMIFEPILFATTGTTVKFNEMDPQEAGIACACLIIGIVIRYIITIGCAIKAKLNLKEKLFVSLCCMTKASVQAALGSVALQMVISKDNEDDISRAKIVQILCVLSIILTAPIGAVLITLCGPKMLTKTTAPPPITEWRRRSHRPSIRDISIIDEDEEDNNKDAERGENKHKNTETETDVEGIVMDKLNVAEIKT